VLRSAARAGPSGVTYYYFVLQSANPPSYASELERRDRADTVGVLPETGLPEPAVAASCGNGVGIRGGALDLNGWLGRSVLTRATSNLLNEYKALELRGVSRPDGIVPGR
jgi:hypothetical protein